MIHLDKDECADGTHTCKGNQECLNRGGGYVCQCPSGHSLTPSGDCEDIVLQIIRKSIKYASLKLTSI
jgi:hypothetical protein